jgi:raffinose/stachyose/melibiose transport system substrate-binding protein
MSYLSMRKPFAVFASLMVFALVTCILAGCGAGSSSSSNGTTTITLSMQNTNVQATDPSTYAIVQAFEKKYPNIKVNLIGQPVAQHLQSLTIAAQSHTLPEIFWVYNSTAAQMSQAGDILDLTPMLKDLNLTSHFTPSMLAQFNSGSVQYGLPYQGLLTGIFYNKKILSDNDLQVPVTFDDYLHIAKVLSSKGIVTLADGANTSNYSVWSFLRDLDNFGYESMYKSILAGKSSYDNPDFLRLYEHIAQLRQAGAFASNVSTQSYFQAMSSFTSGKAAMFDAGVFASSSIQSSPIANQVGFWVGPTFSDGVGNQHIVMNVASAPFAVSAQVKNDQSKYNAVEKFLGFYYSDTGQQLLADNGQEPVTTYKPQVDATKDSVFKTVLDAASQPGLVSPATQPDLAVPTAVANAMYDSIYGVIEGQLTPKQAVDLVQTAIASSSSS